jgi:vacuolar-type H+-ATPase catalytic subunit A/Vma1
LGLIKLPHTPKKKIRVAQNFSNQLQKQNAIEEDPLYSNLMQNNKIVKKLSKKSLKANKKISQGLTQTETKHKAISTLLFAPPYK